MKILDTTALVLIVIGGIVWGIIGFFDYSLIDAIFGAGSVAARTIYAIVGIAALWATISIPSKLIKEEA